MSTGFTTVLPPQKKKTIFIDDTNSFNAKNKMLRRCEDYFKKKNTEFENMTGFFRFK